jgi:hypothetical protein
VHDCSIHLPIENEPLERFDLHPNLFLLNWHTRWGRDSWKAVHRRRQRVRLGGQVARKVDKCLQRLLESLRRTLSHGKRDGTLQLGEGGQEWSRWLWHRIRDVVRPPRYLGR